LSEPSFRSWRHHPQWLWSCSKSCLDKLYIPISVDKCCLSNHRQSSWIWPGTVWYSNSSTVDWKFCSPSEPILFAFQVLAASTARNTTAESVSASKRRYALIVFFLA
jgi:hypothetical protein